MRSRVTRELVLRVQIAEIRLLVPLLAPGTTAARMSVSLCQSFMSHDAETTSNDIIPCTVNVVILRLGIHEIQTLLA